MKNQSTVDIGYPMSFKSTGKIDPTLTVKNGRWLQNYCPRHFHRVSINRKFVVLAEMQRWLMENTIGRFYISNVIGANCEVWFEDQSEAVMFVLVKDQFNYPNY